MFKELRPWNQAPPGFESGPEGRFFVHRFTTGVERHPLKTPVIPLSVRGFPPERQQAPGTRDDLTVTLFIEPDDRNVREWEQVLLLRKRGSNVFGLKCLANSDRAGLLIETMAHAVCCSHGRRLVSGPPEFHTGSPVCGTMFDF